MPRIRLSILATLIASAGLATGALAGPGPCVVEPSLGDPIHVEFQTTAGDFSVELWPDIAPCTVNNFLAYVGSGRYDGTFIHRTAANFVVQGGGFAYDSVSDSFAGIPLDPAVVNEPGESNLTATIAMARVGGEVNSATSQFFINLADNTFLDTVDEGFTVFGQVLPEDMPVVDTIGALPRLVGRWSLNSALRETFGELPVHNLPSDPPGGYGCFDIDATPEIGLSGWIRTLINEAGTFLESDPLSGGLFYLSGTCTGTGAVGPPSVPCVDSRQVAYSDGVFWFPDPTPMSCNALAESEESLAARRDDQHLQVASNLVELTAIVVPEPSLLALCLSGVVGVACLGRLRQR